MTTGHLPNRTSVRCRFGQTCRIDEPPVRAPTAPSSQPRSSRRPRGEHLLILYLTVALIVLLVLRASIDGLAFIGAGWLIVLIFVPLTPILLPRLGDLAKSLSPFVSSFKVGAVQVDLRDVRRNPITLHAAGMLGSVPNDMAPFQSTGLDILTRDLERLRERGGAPVVVIDLRDGTKWRRSNLYLFARLLAGEPVAQLVFTELRGARDGYLVGACRPSDVVQQWELALPVYAMAVATLDQSPLPVPPGMPLLTETQRKVAELSPHVQSGDPDSIGAADVSELLGPLLSSSAIEGIGETLSEEDLRRIVAARLRFVPVTSDGRMLDIIDRDSVGLAVARAALSSSNSSS